MSKNLQELQWVPAALSHKDTEATYKAPTPQGPGSEVQPPQNIPYSQSFLSAGSKLSSGPNS